MNFTVSVIVPTYKVEKYLCKCIDSIINQTYKNLEIILVDDGSPDNCGKICDEYALKDSRVRVIHKENGGLSDARNAGLETAKGDYIGFVDSDDWIELNMYERLVANAVKFDAEISVGGVADILEKDGEYTQFKTTYDGKINEYVLSKEEAMKKYFLGSWSAWDKIYKKEVFDGICFPKGEINEDEAIVLYLLDRCNKIAYTNEVFYNYITRPGSNSITATSFHVKKLAWYKHCKANLEFIKEKYPELTEYAEKRYNSSIIFSLVSISQVDKEQFSDILPQMLSEFRMIYKNIMRNKLNSKREKLDATGIRILNVYGYGRIVRLLEDVKKTIRG